MSEFNCKLFFDFFYKRFTQKAFNSGEIEITDQTDKSFCVIENPLKTLSEKLLCAINNVLNEENIDSNIGYKFELPKDMIKISISLIERKDNKDYIKIQYTTSHTIGGNVTINKKEDDNKIFPASKRITLIVYDYETIYYQASNRKSVGFPMNLKTLGIIHDSIRIEILKYWSYENKIWRDFIYEKELPSISLQQVNSAHNKRELFQNIFGVKLPASINKKTTVSAYAACCAIKYIKPEQINMLLSHNYERGTIKFKGHAQRKEAAKDFIFDYMLNRLGYKKISRKYIDFCEEENDSFPTTLSDYIDFSIDLKQLIDINAGKRKIKKLHDTYVDMYIHKKNRGKNITIPETPLKYLKMPKGFTLIKTKSALEFEGKRNHNCVGTYVDKINKGRCIIYNADILGEHLTIEICYGKKGKKNVKYNFYISQCYKAFNEPCSDNVKEIVQKALDDASEKAVNKYLISSCT